MRTIRSYILLCHANYYSIHYLALFYLPIRRGLLYGSFDNITYSRGIFWLNRSIHGYT